MKSLAATYNIAMQTACAEARKWLGSTSPNPPVGAVALDANGEVVATSAHHRAGELHAEAKLIRSAVANGLLGQITTLCVTLEPCNHFGRTPPCTEAIIRSGIKHVVIGSRDPNLRVKGGGLERLQEAGISVESGVCLNECDQLIHAFAYKAQTGKPWVTIKRALNAGGSMIPPTGQKTFTSPDSLRLAHRLRKKADAIITGSGTILADNPSFTVRHLADYVGKRRWLAIIDRRGRISKDYLHEAETRGLKPILYANIHQALSDLNIKGAQDILIEAGPTLSQALLDAGLWSMRIDIHQGNPDRINAAFNPDEITPFDVHTFDLEGILPL